MRVEDKLKEAEWMIQYLVTRHNLLGGQDGGNDLPCRSVRAVGHPPYPGPRVQARLAGGGRVPPEKERHP
jgi:hypothetical protein